MLLFIAFAIHANAQKIKFVTQVNAGYLLGQNTKSIFTVQNFSGVNIPKYNVDLGFVIGYDHYQPIKILPFAFAIKHTFSSSMKASPYLMLNTGYGFGLKDKSEIHTTYKGGFMLNPSMGLMFNKNGKVGYHLAVGYKTQKATVTQYPDNPSDFIWYTPSVTTANYKLKKVMLSLGISF